MEYSEFTKIAQEEINYIYESLNQSNFEDDFDLVNEVLYIYTNKGDYVINQHSPSSQIWLSSPLSNANYFNYNENTKEWKNKNNQSLREILSEDLQISII